MEMCRYAFEMDNIIDTGEYKCKLFAAPALVNNWADGKSDAYEIPIRFRDELIGNYQKTGISVINKDNWLTKIQEYRNKTIAEWFTKIVKESKDFNDLVQHVNHPTLTHMLISLCINDDEENMYEHQKIKRLAAYKYLLGLGSKDTCEVDDTIDIKEQMIHTYDINIEKEESITEEFNDAVMDEDIEKDETEVIDEYEDETGTHFVSNSNTIEGKEESEYIKLYTADECMFNYTSEEMNEKLQELAEESDKRGYMKTYITHGNKVKFIGFINKDILDKY